MSKSNKDTSAQPNETRESTTWIFNFGLFFFVICVTLLAHAVRDELEDGRNLNVTPEPHESSTERSTKSSTVTYVIKPVTSVPVVIVTATVSDAP